MKGIGEAKGIGPGFKGYYCGPDKRLRGEQAIIRWHVGLKAVVAQFSNTRTGLGYGWHRFPLRHWVVNGGS